MKKKIAIVGGGACALMLGTELNTKKYEVSVFEKNKALGRKFLVAGYGGLNITHSEDNKDFISRYNPQNFIEPYLLHFNNQRLIQWLNKHHVPTYKGSSGRVFPKKELKAIAVLNTLQQAMLSNGAQLFFNHEWLGFDEAGSLTFKTHKNVSSLRFDKVIFCLGGASWPVTGSDGAWTKHYEQKHIKIEPFLPSNCAFGIEWPTSLLEKIEGKALKNCLVSMLEKSRAGELVFTKFGVEGSGIYPFSWEIREELNTQGYATIHLDFKPNVRLETLITKINDSKLKGSYTQKIKSILNLNELQLHLLKTYLTKEEFLDIYCLCRKIKSFELRINKLASIDEAISTVGGVALNEINEHFELKKLPNHFAIGEMLDYDAPTGGYLLQSCFSMAKYLADYLNEE